ncbi:MAG: T9SS type A sorting domain-containing protein [Bacteroidetes bacterium]|nr:T9SS type A sorting domain-containing protein [Bacteroidota bacterium]
MNNYIKLFKKVLKTASQRAMMLSQGVQKIKNATKDFLTYNNSINTKSFKKVLTLAICIAMMLAIYTPQAEGQAHNGILDTVNFPIEVGSEPYVPLTSSQQLTWDGVSSQTHDYFTGYFLIPFPITFDTTTYPIGTRITVMANGWVQIGATATGSGTGYPGQSTYLYTNYPNSTGSYVYRNLIMLCSWDGSCLPENMVWQVLGTAPNRQLVIQFTNLSRYSYHTTQSASVQIIFYENSDLDYPNKIRIHFGPGIGTIISPSSQTNAFISGNTANRLIVFEPANPMQFHRTATSWSTTYPSMLNNFATQYVVIDRYIDFGILSRGPTMDDFIPKDTLFAINPITGDITTPTVWFRRKAGDPPVQIQYIIRNPDNVVVFEARDPNNPSSNWIDIPISVSSDDPIQYTFSNAQGSMVDAAQTARRLTFRTANVASGFYTVEARLRYMNGIEEKISEKFGTFEARYDVDIAAIRIESPDDSSRQTYPLANRTIDFATTFKNLGKNDIRAEYDVRYVVTRIADNSVVYDSTMSIRLTTEISMDQEFRHDVPEQNKFNPQSAATQPGPHRLDVYVTLFNVAELYTGNNHISLIFNIDYPYEGEVVSAAMMSGTSTGPYYVDQVYFPRVSLRNNSAFDVSGIALTATITAPSGAKSVVVQNPEFLPGGSEVVIYDFNMPFIPKEIGMYDIEFFLADDGDSKDANNYFNLSVPVVEGLTGTFNVGSTTWGAQYLTIEQALADVYNRGVRDTVTFVLTDPIYNIGTTNSDYAIDISSSVAGFTLPRSFYGNTQAEYERYKADSAKFNHNKLIRFVPSEELRYMRSSIQINLLSRTGIGMHFGSALSSQFPNASANKISRSISTALGERPKDFYSYNAKLEIDGGANQSISIALSPNVPVNAPNRIPIMLGTGANNIAIKNCVIRGVPLANPQVPELLYDAKWNTFTFGDVDGVAAAILIRNVLPVDHNGVNSRVLDTVLNSNNVIHGNYIENGSYGIMSLGIGPLYNVFEGEYVSYYNDNNVFSNNRINSFDVAGIFLGYENGAKVTNNVIYVIGITNTEENDVAGIMMGIPGRMRIGEEFLGTTGYNNLHISLEGNEISRVYSNKDAYGIKVEQELNNFVYSQITGNKYFANHNDSINIFNNVIWDVKTHMDNYTGSRYGIRLFASRVYDSPFLDKFELFTERRDTTYTISHAKIINNSIIIHEDDNRKVNFPDAYIGGLVVQDVDTIMMFNNAIAVLDETNSADIVAAVVIQSKRPNGEDNGTKFEADNNVYYTPDGSVIRFIEQSQRQRSVISNPGARDQFRGLEQWIFYTNTENTSATSNFYPNLYRTNTNPQLLRVTTPAPIGSYLSGRGKKFDFIKTDIDGNLRGVADQNYDIGAWAFSGQAYENDLGIVNFVVPVASRDYSHPQFGEAEYVMTTAPVDVIVNIRNNGSTPIIGRVCSLQVYQIPDVSSTPEIGGTLLQTYTVNINAAPSETVPVSFNIRNDSPLRFPRSYADLVTTPTPERFRGMANNVTPRYRYEITLPSDQDNTNNTNYPPSTIPAKVVRYYIKKSDFSAIVSANNTVILNMGGIDASYINSGDTNFVSWFGDNYLVPNSDVMSNVAGFLNFKALQKGFKDLGIYYKANDDEEGYDIIDRSVWEPTSVNYSMYRYLFWSDALNDSLTEYQEGDINRFMYGASNKNRKNIIFSSEEISRNSYAYYQYIEEDDFIKSLFGVTPRGTGIYNATYEAAPNSNSVLLTGSTLLPNVNAAIKNNTLYTLDPPKDVRMQPAIFENFGNAKLSSLQALYYSKLVTVNKADKTFGLISFTSEMNAIYLGVDWRHYDDPKDIISAILINLGGFIDDETFLHTEIVNFDANVINNKVVLDWETASEVNVNSFVVEKLNTSNNFANIYETEAKRDNNIANIYTTTDANVQCGNTYTYRLKSINVDGSYNYSSEKSVSIDATSNFISLDKPTPNPVTDNTFDVAFALSNEANIKLSIMDITGKEVMVLVSNQAFSGSNKLSFALNNLPSGSYNLILYADGNSVSQSFTIAK